jgi:hypothetical protein
MTADSSKPLDIDCLRQLATAATPGPWRWNGEDGPLFAPGCKRVMSAYRVDPSHAEIYVEDNNREYIAAVSPDAVLRLLDRVAALEAAAAGDFGPLINDDNSTDEEHLRAHVMRQGGELRAARQRIAALEAGLREALSEVGMEEPDDSRMTVLRKLIDP